MSVPQVRSGSAGSARNVGPSPVVEMPDAGAGLRRAGRQVRDFAQQLQQQRVQADQLKASEAEAKFDRQVRENIEQIDPTAANYDQKVNDAIQKARREALDDVDLETNEVQNRLETTLATTSEQQKLFAFQRRQQGLNQKAQRTLQEQAQTTAAKVRRNPDAFEDFTAEFQAKASEINANLTKEQAARLTDEANQQLIEARALGFAEQGNTQRARAVLDAAGEQFSTSQIRSLKQRVRGIEAQQEQDRLAETQSQVNQLELDIAKARTIGDLNSVQERINSAEEQGVFEGRSGQKTTLQKRVIRRKRQLQEEQQEQTRVLGKLQSGRGFDSQSEADQAWGAIARNKDLANASPQERVNTLSSFVDNGGIVPSAIKQPIENADRGAGGVNNLAEAAAMHSTIQRANPDTDTGAAGEGSRVRLTARLHEDAGLSFDQAAQLVENNVPDPQALKSRREEFENNVASNLDSTEEVRNAISGAEGTFLGLSGEDATVPRDLRQEYRDAFQAHYELIGNKEAARSAAKDFIQERFSVSRVNGEPTVTRAAPERYVPGRLANDFRRAGRGDLVSEAIRNDVTRELKRAGVELPETEDGEPAFRLVASKRTQQQIARGKQPEWTVQVRTDAGFYTPVTVTGQNGRDRNLTYRMMTANQFEGNEVIQSFRDRQLEEGREAREEAEDQRRPGQRPGQGSGRFMIPGNPSEDQPEPPTPDQDQQSGGSASRFPNRAPGQ